MNKYPKNYFSLIGMKNIVLGKDLAFSGQKRAAVPDPYTNAMFYSINGAYGVKNKTYLSHSLHHELHHYTEYYIWKDMRYNRQKWIDLNISGFEYGKGGESAYSNSDTDYYSMTHPKKGFLNLYSMTGNEEDRCELLAFWFTDSEHDKVKEIINKDSILKNKVKLLSQMLLEKTGKQIIDINN